MSEMERQQQRSHRLAGSPSQHDEGTKNAAFNAWESFEGAARYAKAGDCSRALDYYTDGYEYRGSMKTNARWGRAKDGAISDSVRGKLVDAEQAADAAMRRCLVKKAKR
jgi:hypothetical protein